MRLYRSVIQIEITNKGMTKIILKNELVTHYDIELLNLTKYDDLFQPVDIDLKDTKLWHKRRFIK